MDSKLKNPHSKVTFIDNHDMTRFMTDAVVKGASERDARKKLEMAVFLIMTSRGIPCIYYGTEHYLHNDTPTIWGVGSDPYNRQMMTSFDTSSNFIKNIRKLAMLRKQSNALAKGEQKTLYLEDNFFVYERRFKGEVILVALNKDKKSREVVIPNPAPEGKYEKLIGTKLVIKNKKVRISLGPLEIGIWRNISTSRSR